MQVTEVCKNYFNGFQDLSNYEKNDKMTNVLAALKIFSYFIVVIPLALAAVYGAASLYGRISKKQHLSSRDENINDLAKKHFIVLNNPATKQSETTQYKIIQILDSKVVRSYTGDFTLFQKSNLQTNFIDDNTLKICFEQVPTLNVTICRQDIFDSHAEVIINAANNHLGGGGGIDGAIRARGGPGYKAAHHELQMLYNSEYVSGHAAMIESGLLKKDHNIDNVIVVAGPQGATCLKKEDELYSCYYNSLILAENQNKISIAFPAISTGIFRFPKDRAASISLKAIYDFINSNPNTNLKNISIHFLASEPKTNLEIYKAAAV